MIFVVVGTKAQLVKMAPVMQSLDRFNLEYQFVLTGQHAETMDDLIGDFSLRRPDWSFVEPIEADSYLRLLVWLAKAAYGGYKGLGGERGGGSLMLVHGDTLSTLLGAVVGRLRGMRVMHVEAGLRSFNYFNPFPEEIVRVLVARFSSYFVCQDKVAVNNLEDMGITGSRVLNTNANTLFDALSYVTSNKLDSTEYRQPYCVVSLHRSENLSSQQRFEFLMRQIIKISRDTPVLFVLHPVTRKKLNASGWMEKFNLNPDISLLERMPYSRFMSLLSGANFLVTDGGSNQEEAYYLGLPCLLMRKATERIEGLKSNAVLSQYNEDIIQGFFADLEENRRSPVDVIGVSPSDQVARFIQVSQKGRS